MNWSCRCDTEEERQDKLDAVYMLAKDGRGGSENHKNYKKCETLLALFCMKKEKENTRKGRTSSLMKKGGLSPEEMTELKNECHEKRWADLMPATRRAMLLLMIENNVYKNDEGKYFVYEMKYERNVQQQRKYTDRKSRSREGGWSQAGVDRYWEIYDREMEDEKKNIREIGTDKMKFDLKMKEVDMDESRKKKRKIDQTCGEDAMIEMGEIEASIEMLSSDEEDEGERRENGGDEQIRLNEMVTNVTGV